MLGLIAHVPLLFLGETVLSLMLAGPLAYTSAITAASIFLAYRSRRLLVASVLPAVLATLHLSYGAGALVGLVQMGAALLFGSSGAAEGLARTPTRGSRRGRPAARGRASRRARRRLKAGERAREPHLSPGLKR